jgi:hypothetical protein
MARNWDSITGTSNSGTGTSKRNWNAISGRSEEETQAEIQKIVDSITPREPEKPSLFDSVKSTVSNIGNAVTNNPVADYLKWSAKTNLDTAGKVANYVNDNVLNVPTDIVLNTSKNIKNVAQGKPLTWKKNYDQSEYLKNEVGIDVNAIENPWTRGLAKATLNTLYDPLTYLGGGIADDVMKQRNTLKNIGTLGDFQKVATAKSIEVPKVTSIPAEVGRQTKIKGIDDFIVDQENIVNDLRYQRSELGADTTKQIEEAERKLNQLKVKKNLPNIEMQISDLEKIQGDLFNEGKSLTPEFSQVSDSISRLKSAIREVQPKKLEPPTLSTANDTNTLKPKSVEVATVVTPQQFNVSKPNAKPTFSNPDSINASNTNGDRVSGLYNTIKSSDVLTNQEKKLIKQDDFTYTPKTEEESLNNAASRISSDIDEEIQKLSQKEVYTGEDVDTAMGILKDKFVKEARQTGDYSKVKEWLRIVKNPGATEAGRTVQAWAKYSRTSEGALMDLQSTVDKIHDSIKLKNPRLMENAENDIKNISEIVNEIMDSQKRGIKINLQLFAEKLKKVKSINTMDELKKLMDKANSPEKLKELIYERYRIPHIKDEDISFVTDSMDKLKNLDPASYEYRRIVADVGIRINRKIPPEFEDSMKGLQRIMMLTAPKTWITRNPVSNLLLGALEDLTYMFRVPLDIATSAITKKRTTKFIPIKGTIENIKGSGQGISEWWKDIKYNTNTAPTGGQAEFVKGRLAFNEMGRGKLLARVGNAVDGFVGHALQLGDRPFFQSAYNRRMAELQKINKATEITDDMAKEAYEWALERTFQNDSEISKIFVKFKDLSQNPAYKLFANLVLPFAKTPANILDKFIEYTPVGVIKPIIEVANGNRFNQAKFVNTLSRTMTGTGIGIVGFLMARNGMITPGFDSNRKAESLETALGKQNYAFKFGDNYYSFDWAIPATAMLATGADYWKAMKNSKDYQNAAVEGTKGAVNTLFKQTVLQGPSKLLSGYNPAASLASFALGATTQFTPSAAGQIAKATDNVERETYDPNQINKTVNQLKSRFPGSRQTLQPKVDVLGNEVKVDQGKTGIQKGFDIFLNPGYLTKYAPDKVQSEIIRLYDEAGQTGQLPAVAEKYFDATKQHPRVTLTPEEYTQYQKRIGQLTINGGSISGSKIVIPGFKGIINTESYRKADDKTKAAMLSKAVSNAKEIAKNEILKQRGLIK